MARDAVLEWLLEGDAAVRFQTTRDLLHRDAAALQPTVATQGDGATISDGGFNCRRGPDVRHSSMHTTLPERAGRGSDPV